MFSISQLQLSPPKHWQDFESLCHEVFREDWRDFFAQKHGRPGHKQHGVDVYGVPLYKQGYTGVQCKCRELSLRRRLTASELRREVAKAEKFKPPLDRFILATPLPRNPRLQQLAREISAEHRRRGLFTVHVLAWDDITDMLDRHPHLATRYYGVPSSGSSTSAIRATSPPMPSPKTTPIPSSQTATKRSAVRQLILPAHTHRALGIIATSPVPCPDRWLHQFFPNIPWSQELKVLFGAHAVLRANGTLVADERTCRSFLESPDDRRPFLHEWVEALTPRQAHVDVAIFLSIQHLCLRNVRQSVMLLVDIAHGLEPGFWNERYRQMLLPFDSPKILQALLPEQRVQFLNALGLCFARGMTPLDAIPWFRRMRTYSRRIGNSWGIGQSYINEGVAFLDAHDTRHAEASLNRAVAYAKEHRDHHLLGRALHNLVTLSAARDPNEAERLLRRSVAAKKIARDDPNGASPLFCRGLIAAYRGDPANALRWFARAEKAAYRIDQRDTRCVAICNMAKAHLELGHSSKAATLFRAARKMCETEGFRSLLVLVLRGEAYARYLLRQYARSAPLYSQLHDLLVECEQGEDAVIALHDAAVCLSKAANPRAPRLFRQAVELARKYRVVDWLYHCRKDEAFLRIEKGEYKLGQQMLRRAADEESRLGNHAVAARLLEDNAQVLIEHDAPSTAIEESFRSTLSAWRKAGDSTCDTCRVYGSLYTWQWSTGRFSQGLQTLRKSVQFACRRKSHASQCTALDQLGVCLQELGSYRDAEAAHRQAIDIARRLDDPLLLQRPCNNLGELLRKTGHPDDAVMCLAEAENLAKKRGDAESLVSIAHNRALALFAAGRRSSAWRLLRACCRRARRAGWHREFVRAEHGLANFAWEANRPREAERLYRRALKDAQSFGIQDQIWEVSLNYGNLLRWKKSPRLALAHFKTAAALCDNPTELSLCFEQLAACREQLGDLCGAGQDWRKCYENAEAAGDREKMAVASASLACVHAGRGDFGTADEQMKLALKLEGNANDRAYLLYDRLKMLLAAGEDKKAERVFEAIRKQAQTNAELKDLLVDAHVLLADHVWSAGKSPLEALKAFVVALGDAYALSFERAMQVGGHFGRTMMLIPRTDRIRRIDEHEAQLVAWLNQQTTKPLSPSVLRMLLWPLRLAKRLAVMPADGRRLSTKAISDLIAVELGLGTSNDLRNGKKPTRRNESSV